MLSASVVVDAINNPLTLPSECLSPIGPDPDLDIWNCVDEGFLLLINPASPNPFNDPNILNVEHSFEPPLEFASNQAPDKASLYIQERIGSLGPMQSTSMASPLRLNALVTSSPAASEVVPTPPMVDPNFNLRLDVNAPEGTEELVLETFPLSPRAFLLLVQATLSPPEMSDEHRVEMVESWDPVEPTRHDVTPVLYPTPPDHFEEPLPIDQNTMMDIVVANVNANVPATTDSPSMQELLQTVERILPAGSKAEVVGSRLVDCGTKSRNIKPQGSRRSPPPAKKPVYKPDAAYDGIDTEHKMRNIARFLVNATRLREIQALCVSFDMRIKPVERTRYFRDDIKKYVKNHGDFVYLPYEDYERDDLYSPQYYRVRMDYIKNSKGEVRVVPFNNTRHALCPYCPQLAFFDLKTTAYGQHLAYHHGVFLNGFLAPDPLFYGRYRLAKSNQDRLTRAHIRTVKAVMCPTCHELIEVESNRMTRDVQPLYNYLRHFKQKHRRTNQQTSDFTFFDKVVSV